MWRRFPLTDTRLMAAAARQGDLTVLQRLRELVGPALFHSVEERESLSLAAGESGLVAGIGMDRGHDTAFDAHSLMQHLRKGCEAVRRA